jgi:hypothetical protein
MADAELRVVGAPHERPQLGGDPAHAPLGVDERRGPAGLLEPVRDAVERPVEGGAFGYLGFGDGHRAHSSRFDAVEESNRQTACTEVA